MKKIALSLLFAAFAFVAQAAIIKITGAPADSIWIQPNVVSEIFTENQGVRYPIQAVTDAAGNATITTTDTLPMSYMIVLDQYTAINMPSLFMNPGDEVTVAYNPGSAFPTFSGTKNVADAASFESDAQKIINNFQALASSDSITDNQRRRAYEQMFADLQSLIKANPSNPGAVFLMAKLPTPIAADCFNDIHPEAYNGIMTPIYSKIKTDIEAYRAKQAAKENIAVGKPAPDFTLPDLQGKEISLSSLRGKYVIIDFWGSWCGWCIKGFPALKQNYDELKDYIEVLGIDCGDTEAKWRDAVAKYELPWINVRETKEMPMQPTQVYAIEGFPTKFIISPEGTILDITVGEDPEFFTRLKTILGK